MRKINSPSWTRSIQSGVVVVGGGREEVALLLQVLDIEFSIRAELTY